MLMPAPFTIRVTIWAEALPLARPVRERVFIDEQRVPQELEWDEWDEASEHAVALDVQGNPIGTARLLPDGRIGRMAVLKEWRGKGVGGALLEAMLGRARARSMPSALLHAQTHAAGFYRRFGFSERGEEFLEAGIPHVEMRLDLFRQESGDS
jgi:predicted GNAT family N-acyltransferase